MPKFLDIKTVLTIATVLVTVALAWGTMSAKVERFSLDLREVKRSYIEADTRLASAQAEVNSRFQAKLDNQSDVLIKIQVDIAGMRSDIRAILAQLSTRQKQEEQ